MNIAKKWWWWLANSVTVITEEAVLWTEGNELLWTEGDEVLWGTDVWILATNTWNDSGIWIDSQTWND